MPEAKCKECGKPVPNNKAGKPLSYCDKRCNWRAWYYRKHGRPGENPIKPSRAPAPPAAPPPALTAAPVPQVVAQVVEPIPPSPASWTPAALEEDLHHVAQTALDLHSAMRMMPAVDAFSLRIRVDRSGQVTIEAPEFLPTRR